MSHLKYFTLMCMQILFCIPASSVGMMLQDSITVSLSEIDSTSTAISEDTRFAGWTEEKYKSFEDSVWAVLYPPVYPQKADSTFFAKNNDVLMPRASSSVSFISNNHVPKSVSLDKSKEVGEIVIKSGTAQTGARTYEIPINVYPGMAGFNPNLSLTYNSFGENSIMGMGWSISGLPTITRGKKTLYYDNKTEGVLMNNTEAFFLDGKRLVRIGSTSEYILYQSEYDNTKVKGYIWLCNELCG